MAQQILENKKPIVVFSDEKKVDDLYNQYVDTYEQLRQRAKPLYLFSIPIQIPNLIKDFVDFFAPWQFMQLYCQRGILISDTKRTLDIPNFNQRPFAIMNKTGDLTTITDQYPNVKLETTNSDTSLFRPSQVDLIILPDNNRGRNFAQNYSLDIQRRL